MVDSYNGMSNTSSYLPYSQLQGHPFCIQSAEKRAFFLLGIMVKMWICHISNPYYKLSNSFVLCEIHMYTSSHEMLTRCVKYICIPPPMKCRQGLSKIWDIILGKIDFSWIVADYSGMPNESYFLWSSW